MSTQLPNKFETLREPTGPEVSRRATIGRGLSNLEFTLRSVEETAPKLQSQQPIVDISEPKHTTPADTLAGMVVETSTKDISFARQAVTEAFSNAN